MRVLDVIKLSSIFCELKVEMNGWEKGSNCFFYILNNSILTK